MPVNYNGNALIPAPQFNCVKDYQTTDDGSVIGKTYQIQLKGKFVSWMGSPNASGTFWTGSGTPPDDTPNDQTNLGSQLRKQQAIRRLFTTQGAVLEIKALDGSVSFSCNPRIVRVETPEGPLTQLSDYIVYMECDQISVGGAVDDDGIDHLHLQKASEEWNIEVSDEHLMTYRLTHSVNAIGRRVYVDTAKEPWQYAQDYVTQKLGLDTSKMVGAGVINGDALQAYNYMRGQSVNELTGSFSVSETWVCYAGGSAYEEFTVTTRTSQEGRSSVNVNGTITGLATYDNATAVLSTSRYTNADAKWTAISSSLFSRAQTQSGITLNPTVLTTEVGRNEVSGTISYNYEYDDRPAALLAGAKSTSIFQTDDNAADVFASIPVVGRLAGPILQPIGTVTQKKRVIALTAQFPVATYSSPTVNKPNSNSVFPPYIPSANQVFIDQDQEGWTAVTGQYTRTVSFTYQ